MKISKCGIFPDYLSKLMEDAEDRLCLSFIKIDLDSKAVLISSWQSVIISNNGQINKQPICSQRIMPSKC